MFWNCLKLETVQTSEEEKELSDGLRADKIIFTDNEIVRS